MRAARAFAVAATALVLAVPGLEAQIHPLEGLDAYIRQAMEEWQVPGLAIAVVKDDSVVLARGYGVLEAGGHDPVDEHTLFPIASTTKAMTAAALAMLVDEGRLSWGDPVTRHLPWFQLEDPWVTRALTVRDLLTHRVGVGRYDNLWIAAPFDREEILRRARHLPTVAGFRDRYGYNNIMYIAAGELVAAVSGMSWDDFLATRLFEPLGMTRSTTRTREVEERGNAAASHTEVEGRVQAVPRRNYDNIGGAGAVFSSAHDMARWLRLHLGSGEMDGRRLLSQEAVETLHTPVTIMPMDSLNRRLFPGTHLRAYALGWYVQDHHGRKLIHHSGSINYTRTHVALVPSEGLGFVAMANLSSSALQLALMKRVVDAYLGLPPTDWSAEYLALERRDDQRSDSSAKELEEARLEGTSPSLPLGAYAGTYESEIYGPVEIALEEGSLVLRYSPEYVADLEHWHQDVFRARWRRPGAGRAFVTFALDARARVPTLELGGFGEFVRNDEAPGR